MRYIYSLLLIFGLSFAAFADDTPATDGPQITKADDIIQYVQDMITWHRQITTAEAPSDNSRQILIAENLRASSAKTINYVPACCIDGLS